MTTIKTVKLAFKIFKPNIESDKNDLILIHGITASKEDFDDVSQDIAVKTGRKVYALDTRNHGDSEWSDDFTLESMAADVINFMDENGIKIAAILGHSMGGRLAMYIALTYPGRVEKIIVEDMTPKGLPENLQKGYSQFLNLMHEAIYTVPTDVDFTTATLMIFQSVFQNVPKDIFLGMKEVEGKTTPLSLVYKDGKYSWKANYLVLINGIESLKFSEDLKGIFEKPALFLYGTVSEFKVGGDEDFILKLFPKAQLRGLVSSHRVHYERSEEYVNEVKEFLK